MSTVLLNLTDIAYTCFSNPILQGLNWEIQAGQKIGLVGANGSGKSTLLKLILGQLTPEAGAIFRVKDLTIGYLPQEVEPDPPAPFPTREGGDTSPLLAGEGAGGEVAGGEVTVLDVALSGSPEIGRLRRELAEREAQMGDPAVYDDPARLARVMDAHARLLHDYEVAGGLTYENRVRSTLRDLGLGDETFDRPFAVLSGGQAKLVGLARLLVWRPNLLLLDEPDNHLDVAHKQIVERLVAEYEGAVIIVSHDRYLLDQCVNRIAELDRGQITVWLGTYSTYALNKQLANLRQEQLYKAQQKRISQIEAAIARFELWASIVVNERHARQARARYKMLERMERIERPGEQRRMKLDLGGWRGSNKVLEISKLVKWFEDAAAGDMNIVLDGVNLLIWHGERVGLVGPNGAGKSVLFRCILAAAAGGSVGDRPEQATQARAGLRPSAVAPIPGSVGDRPKQLGDRPKQLGDRPKQLGDRPEQLGDRPEQTTEARAGLRPSAVVPAPGSVGDRPEQRQDQPDSGTLKLGPSVKIGYYAQQHETLHGDWTVMQEIRDLRPMYETEAVAFLGKFLFTYEACQKQVRQLSGGERSRLQLARLMLSDANFLLLDEPTNNLDIPSAEVLEAALEEFNGTVLVISHDRYFLDRIVDRVAGLENGRLAEVEGGYSDYLIKFGGKRHA